MKCNVCDECNVVWCNVLFWYAMECNASSDTEPFRQLYAADFPPKRLAPRLQPLNCAQIRKVVQLPQPALIYMQPRYWTCSNDKALVASAAGWCSSHFGDFGGATSVPLIWGSLRLRQLNTWLAAYSDKLQAPGGPDVYSLLLSLSGYDSGQPASGSLPGLSESTRLCLFLPAGSKFWTNWIGPFASPDCCFNNAAA